MRKRVDEYMCASSTINEEKQIPKLNNSQELCVRLFELHESGPEKKLSNLINELNSKGLMFSIKITKTNRFLIVYNSYSAELDEERQKNLISHLRKKYSLIEKTVEDGFFISSIKRVEQDGRIIRLQHQDNSCQYILACLLSVVDSNKKSIRRNFTSFMKDLVEANIFSLIISQFTSLNNSSKTSPTWGLLLVTRSENKDVIKKKEKTLQRYIKANQIKLNSQLLFLSKKDVVKHKANFRLFVPWLKHSGLMKDIFDFSKFFSLERRRVETIDTVDESIPEETMVLQTDLTNKSVNNEQIKIPDRLEKKPFQSVKNNKIYSPKVQAPSFQKVLKDESKYVLSKIDDLDVPTPRSMNMVFDAEYLKVRISKVFKEFEFKETMIFEENFDLVLRKGTYYVFVKFFKEILNQNRADQIVEQLSSIAGLRNQFLCIVVADVVEDNSRKLLNEYNILHLTLTDVLVNDSLKAKIYGTILV